jgi:hypothetical protein
MGGLGSSEPPASMKPQLLRSSSATRQCPEAASSGRRPRATSMAARSIGCILLTEASWRECVTAFHICALQRL